MLLAMPAIAEELRLTSPIDCDLTETCYIQNFVDHDPSSEYSDFRCNALSYDTHKGTDFALPNYEMLKKGVNVIASVPGVVRGARDGVRDAVYTKERADELKGKECGNGVVIAHEGGWQTQYCHMRNGSVTVKTGDKVERGAILGKVGLSGKTQFPHVHISVRKGKDVIDPFSPEGRTTCDNDEPTTLWDDPAIVYRAGGVLQVGFDQKVPEYNDVKRGSAGIATAERDIPALVLYAFGFGAREWDELAFEISDGDDIFFEHIYTFDKTKAQWMRAGGRKNKRNIYAIPYTGTVRLIRDGEVISTKTATIEIQ